LSLATAEMGRLADATNPYLARVQPLIEILSARLNESVMVCRFSRTGPLCVSVALAERPITVSIRVGTGLDLLTSAQGRLWLAELEPGEREKHIAGAGAAAGSDRRLDMANLDRELKSIRAQGYA